MSLEIEERDREGIAILCCKGRLVLGPEAESFRETTGSLIKTGKCNIILDMKEVDHIDSSGLGELIVLNRKLGDAGGKVALVALDQKHLDLLVMTKLTTVFPPFETEQDAVNSFFPDRQVPTFDLLEFVQDIKDEK